MEYAFLEKSKLDKFKNYIPEEIAASPVIISALGKKTPDSIVRYKDAMGQMIRNFGNVLQKKELYSGLFNNQFIDESVFYVKAGEICGCILLTDAENGGITLEFAYVDVNKVNNVILIEMIAIALQNISKRYSENTIIDVVTISDVSRKLTEKIVNIDNDITKISRCVMSIM